jgi:hypothetical protein
MVGLRIMEIIIFTYGIGALFVALRLGWHMIFGLDRFDWQYNKGDILGTFVTSIVLWPLMIIKLKNIIDPGKLFEGKFEIASRMRELNQLLNNPPPISSVLRYKQDSHYAETYGEFLFPTTDVERFLNKKLKKNQRHSVSDEAIILNWIQNRNDNVEEPTDVPKVLSKFHFFAYNLVRDGCATIRCLKCGVCIERNDIVIKDAGAKLGWNSDLITCPQGHNLLVIRRRHVTGGPRNIQ